MKSLKVTKSLQILFCFVIFAVALVSRFYLLTNKPIHFDEGINGWFVMQMEQMKFYRYDPHNYHGPLYFYLLQVFETLWGRSLFVLRTLPAVFSIAAVMFSLGHWIRSYWWGMVLAILFLWSPAFLFFGRSGIHEMPFVFFQIVFFVGVLRWLEKEDSLSLAFVLCGLWGMVTLKETFALVVLSLLAALASLGWRSVREVFSWSKLKAAWSPALNSLSLLLLLLFVALFTGFFRNWPGLVDFFKAFMPWLKTGVHGQGHDKEFLYWFKVLSEAEWLALAGLAFSIIGLFSKDRLIRVASTFAMVNFLLYSLIPYKTVWCVLSIVWPFYLVLAFFCEKILRQNIRGRILLAVVLSCGLVNHSMSAWRSVYRQPVDFDHPYIYVNSTYDLKELTEMILKVLSGNPELRGAAVQIGMKEQWPWPWTLRSSLGLQYHLCRNHIVENALVYLCDLEDQEALEKVLGNDYIQWRIPLRQSKGDSIIFLRAKEFLPFMEDRL